MVEKGENRVVKGCHMFRDHLINADSDWREKYDAGW